MIKDSIYLCGCVKNCYLYLEYNLNSLINIGKLFKNYKLIMSYDISSDNSLKILNKFKNKNKNIIIIQNKNKLSDLNVANISKARNKILNKIREINDTNYKYFIMMDMDDRFFNKNINIKLFKKVMDNNNNWDSISFNHNNYYDIWALSYYPFVYSCHHYYDMNSENKKFKKYKNIMRKDIKNVLNKLDNDQYLDVYSAFCGFSIYKINKFINSSYSWQFKKTLKLIPKHAFEKNIKICRNVIPKGLKTNLLMDCEHRYFHLRAKYLNNSQIKICKHPLFI